MKKVYEFALAGLASVLALSGCGMPGAPQPPSLNLPEPVRDLSAARAGNMVNLTWTMPKKNTDKLLLKGNIEIRVCRKEGTGSCEATGGALKLAPGAEGAFSETLPQALTSGTPRALSYFVELQNRNGRSAGLSNAAEVVAGAAPLAVTALRAEVRKDGVLLHWNSDGERTAVRLYRKIIASQSTTQAKPQHGLLQPLPQPVEVSLLVENGEGGRALNKDSRPGETYEYRAQRIARVAIDGKTQELAGPLSAPVRVEVADVFPPSIPTELDAVATVGHQNAETAIDLSWQPVADADLAGYRVYRYEEGSGWRRISTAQPLATPAFHDTDVQPGHSYRYEVSAVGQNGQESARSVEAQETVPNP